MVRAHRFLLSLGIASLLGLACSSETGKKSERLCTPGQYVFCRCQDRSEGAKLCKEDGASFEPCEPCESLGLGEDYDPGPVPDDFDAGGPPPRCGDGVVDRREDCDDDNDVEDDGCTKDCKLSPIAPSTPAAVASTSCPGLEVHVWGAPHAPTTTGTTVGSGNRSTTACAGPAGSTTGSTATDRVFKVVAHATGKMTVTISDASFNQYLYVVPDTCPAPGGAIQPLACVNAADGNTGETLEFAVESGKKYYVFVDGTGVSGNTGTFRVTFEID